LIVVDEIDDGNFQNVFEKEDDNKKGKHDPNFRLYEMHNHRFNFRSHRNSEQVHHEEEYECKQGDFKKSVGIIPKIT